MATQTGRTYISKNVTDIVEIPAANQAFQRNRDALHNIALYKFPILFYSYSFDYIK